MSEKDFSCSRAFFNHSEELKVLFWHDLSHLERKTIQKFSSGKQLGLPVWRNDKRISPFWKKATFRNQSHNWTTFNIIFRIREIVIKWPLFTNNFLYGHKQKLSGSNKFMIYLDRLFNMKDISLSVLFALDYKKAKLWMKLFLL